MTTLPTLRRSTAADTETLLPLTRGYADFSGQVWDETRTRAALALVHHTPNAGGVWLVELGGRVVGYAVLAWGFSLEFGGRDAFLDELFIAPEHRGAGIGRQVMPMLEAEARAAEVCALHLEVHVDNRAAISLYKSDGFEHRTRYHLMTKLL